MRSILIQMCDQGKYGLSHNKKFKKIVIGRGNIIDTLIRHVSFCYFWHKDTCIKIKGKLCE